MFNVQVVLSRAGSPIHQFSVFSLTDECLRANYSADETFTFEKHRRPRTMRTPTRTERILFTSLSQRDLIFRISRFAKSFQARDKQKFGLVTLSVPIDRRDRASRNRNESTTIPHAHLNRSDGPGTLSRVSLAVVSRRRLLGNDEEKKRLHLVHSLTV